VIGSGGVWPESGGGSLRDSHATTNPEQRIEEHLLTASKSPLQVRFEPPPEIFATDSHGAFQYELRSGKERYVETAEYDEVRLIVSVQHPSPQHTIDFDRAYLELRGSLDRDDEHLNRLAEIEPVVSPYDADSFDGWIVLPVFADRTAFSLFGSGFNPRSRLEIRSFAYFVA